MAPSAFLVVTTTLGFFALVCLLFFRDIPEGTKDILQVLLGGVLGQWTAIIQYHFGSSAGSAAKTAMMNEKDPAALTVERKVVVKPPTEPPKENP